MALTFSKEPLDSNGEATGDACHLLAAHIGEGQRER